MIKGGKIDITKERKKMKKGETSRADTEGR